MWFYMCMYVYIYIYIVYIVYIVRYVEVQSPKQAIPGNVAAHTCSTKNPAWWLHPPPQSPVFRSQMLVKLGNIHVEMYDFCESGIAYPIMFQWLTLRINVPVRRRHTGSCFRIADLFSSAAVGLEPKRPVRIAPLVLDHRVFSCDIILDP